MNDNYEHTGDGLLTREQLANRYHVSIRTIQKWKTRRRIPFIQIGRVVRFDAASCDKALKKWEVKCPDFDGAQEIK